ncbi:ABC transporter permease [Magnetofaba australis]|uniref:Transport permease protein n=1 Tax=Magnetofaba australis IT-1 TaxID=1434232 RepID=A0A1Y2K3D8_9PROT|nr:ABC transporter permease [Magnetofaba australis]OSM02146.1 putative ABC transporter [Magnetofaba australis IT-1]
MRDDRNWYGAWSLFRREVRRFMRVFGQTVGAPLVTSLLYFAVFGAALGSRIGPTEGVGYLTFLATGLAAMGVMQHAYQNASSSLIQMRYAGMIQMDLAALPVTPAQMVLAVMGGAMARGLLVGAAVLLAARVFTPFGVAHPLWLLAASLALAGLFGLIGLFSGLWAKSFDDTALVSNFVITPLVYLGGVFFSVEMIDAAWRPLALVNPVYHLVELFRYALLGLDEAVLWRSGPLTLLAWAGLYVVAVWRIGRGWRLKD